MSRPAGLLKRMREVSAPAAKRTLLRTGAYAAIRRLRSSRDVAILRYHAVCGPEGHAYASPAICVTPDTFERHVAYLAGHYTVLPLPEVVAAISAGRTLPKDAVVFTFDDGYADNLAAARVLKQHGVSGTFYITAGCLSGGQPFWPAELRHLLRHLPAGTLTLQAGAASVTLEVSDEASRAAAVGRLTRLFKAHPIPVREAIRERLREAASAPPMPRVMLTWEELAEMARLGMTIGAHTMTHPNLPSAGLADATVEITSCRQRLERELGVAVTMFSYPNGGAEKYYTPELQRVVHQAGFLSATTSRNGFAPATSDVYALRRVQVSGSLEELAFALEVERFILQPPPREGEAS
jgi:peptidoglycan/xylan/chitin deacetylase (PgdA/CDA1 family)